MELEYPRQNANRIDIESNWDKNPVEPEVAVLGNRFTDLMNSDAPIECGLNMHSAVACKRYFVYHAAAGTRVRWLDIVKQGNRSPLWKTLVLTSHPFFT
ncbi:hypothetical protein IIA29_05115 [candidate division KSB1 bacterium]|nr:hypothetical protein [candidate division KSB1 bacterium]